MSLTIPTTSQVSSDIVSQIEAEISQTVPLLPKAFTRVLAKALAGVLMLLFKYCGFVFLQMFVQHATLDETTINGTVVRPLVLLGELFGVGQPQAATRAELTIELTVDNQDSSTVNAGLQLLRKETGVIYLTQSAIVLDAATKSVDVIASSDQDGNGGAGSIGNLEVGDTIELANPIAGLVREAEVTAEVTAGADAETAAAYRQRIIDRVQKKPQGGAYADYEQWAEEVEGIINAYPYTGDPGEVDVYCEATEASSGSADGFPTSAQLDDVLESIEQNVAGVATRRPVNAAVNVLSITRTEIDFTIDGLDGENSAQMQTDITSGIEEFLLSREPFIVGLSVLPRKDRITTAEVSGIVSSIVHAAGGAFDTVTMLISGTEFNSYELGEGEKAKAGTVQFV